MSNTIFCNGEGRRFPKDEFSGQDLLIHNTQDLLPHYASTGCPVGEKPNVPGPLEFDLRHKEENEE